MSPRVRGSRPRRISVGRASVDRTSVRMEQSVAAELALVNLAEAATAGRPPQQVLEMVTKAAATLAGAATVHLWLARSGSRELELAAASGARPGRKDFQPQMALSAHEGLVGWVAQHREPLVVISLRQKPDLVNLAWARDQGFVSFAGVPLARGEQVLGVLGLFTWRRHRFTRREVAFLRGFAANAAVALDNARLYAETRAHELEVAALADATREFSATLRHDDIVAALVQAAVRLIPARWYLLTLDPKTREVQSALVADRNSILARSTRDVEPALMRISDIVAASSTLLHVRTLDALPVDNPARVHLERLNVKSAILVPVGPLSVPRAILATFSCDDTTQPFTERDVRLSQALADRGRIALENARLFEELTQAYRELRSTQEQLIRTEKLRALGEMAAGVAHDFNNLLAVILPRVQLLQRHVDDPKLTQWLQVVEQAVQDGAQMVRQVRAFTRVQSNEPMQAVDLNEVIRDTVEMTRPHWRDHPLGGHREIDVQMHLDEIPPVDGQPAELRVVLTNLILNAVDALGNGGILRIASGRAGDGVEVSVTDTGRGMSEEVRRRIFEPFFSTKGSRGTGLGLAMVYGIVARHGGEITVDSTEGVGSTFTVRLPIGREGTGKSTQRVRTEAPALRVLLIEDDLAVCEALADTLRLQHHDVVVAKDGAEGLTRLRSGSFDVVMTDLVMPGISGWEVARTIKARWPTVRVALVTATALDDSPEELRARGIDAVVVKPVGFEELETLIAGLRRPDDPTGSR
jgi:signal transduction histidine kinase/CheY-like chemotaxis protein